MRPASKRFDAVGCLRKSAQIGLCDAEIRAFAENIFRLLQASFGRAHLRHRRLRIVLRHSRRRRFGRKKHLKKAVWCNVDSRVLASWRRAADSIGVSAARSPGDRARCELKIIPPKC